MARKQIGYVELQWKCPRCGSLNPGPQQTCGNCGGPQPQDVKFQQAASQELIQDEAAKKAAAAGPDIHCPFCGTRNPAGTQTCRQCGGDLAEGTKREAGQVVGSFSFDAPKTTLKCPNCGAENPDTALSCQNCGASLAQEPAPAAPPAPAPAAQKGRPAWIFAVGVILVLAICGAITYYMFLARRTEASTGMVQSLRWERSIPIEALVAVEYEAWKDQIPQDAEVGGCRQEIRSVQSEPVPNSVEVCGTPYTEDTGSGYGEVVQDCEYQVYDDLCSYSVEEWREVDTAVLSGEDRSPAWPEPQLEQGQRVGEDASETYTIVFRLGDELYTYSTSDFDLFQQAEAGETWTLNINSFGRVVSVEP